MSTLLLKRDGATFAGLTPSTDEARNGEMSLAGVAIFTRNRDAAQLKADAVIHRPIELEVHGSDHAFKGMFCPREVTLLGSIHGEDHYRVRLTTSQPVELLA